MNLWNLLESKFEERGVILKSFQERRFRQHALLRAWCGKALQLGAHPEVSEGDFTTILQPCCRLWRLGLGCKGGHVDFHSKCDYPTRCKKILFSKYVCMCIYIYTYIVHIFIIYIIIIIYIYVYIHLEWRETQQKAVAIGILEWFGPHIENQNGLKLSKSGLGRWPCGRVFLCCWTCPLAKGGASRREMPKSIGTQKKLRVKTKASPLVN